MYNVESKPAKRESYFSPDQARNYYGKYARTGVTIHWWGGGESADKHDSLVNYFLRQTTKSVNYVLSDNKITMMVHPDNVAWTSQSGNATTISIEHQPTLGNEGYKKSGWLVWQLELRYGRSLQLFPHKYWFSTACPGSISLDRIRQEADKWRRGEYNEQPVPVPTPPPSTSPVTFTKLPTPQVFVTNKQPTHLWKMDSSTWNMPSVKTFNKGEQINVYGLARNNKLGVEYYVTEYSFNAKIPNGFSKADMDVYVAPTPQPDPTPIPPPDPTPVPTPDPEKPEWEKNLQDIDSTKYWVKSDINLKDITTGKDVSPVKSFLKDSEFVAEAKTLVGGVSYVITQYSFDKKIFNGLPVDSLTLTPPGVPDVPPTPVPPVDPVDQTGLLKVILELLKKIVEFLGIK